MLLLFTDLRTLVVQIEQLYQPFIHFLWAAIIYNITGVFVCTQKRFECTKNICLPFHISLPLCQCNSDSELFDTHSQTGRWIIMKYIFKSLNMLLINNGSNGCLWWLVNMCSSVPTLTEHSAQTSVSSYTSSLSYGRFQFMVTTDRPRNKLNTLW